MSEPFYPEQAQIPNEEVRKRQFTERLQTRVSAVWDSCVGDFGYCDLSTLGGRLWRSLYKPQHALEGVGDKVRQGTKDELAQPIPLAPGEHPDLETQFIKGIYEAIETVDVQSTLFPGAMEQLHKLDQKHNILVWTAGSRQHQKIKLARSGLTDPSFRHLEVLYPTEINTAINEDKFTDDIIEEVKTFAQGKKVVVVEDRVKNIIKFLEAFPKAKAVWVQQGAHAKAAQSRIASGELTDDERALQELEEQGRVTVIAAIGGLNDAVTRLHPPESLAEDESLAIVCDFDDTLSDNAMRRNMDQRAIVEKLEENQWAVAA